MLARGPLQCIEVRQGEIRHASYISRRLGCRLVKPSHESLKVSLRRCHVAPRVLDKARRAGLRPLLYRGRATATHQTPLSGNRNCNLRRKLAQRVVAVQTWGHHGKGESSPVVPGGRTSLATTVNAARIGLGSLHSVLLRNRELGRALPRSGGGAQSLGRRPRDGGRTVWSLALRYAHRPHRRGRAHGPRECERCLCDNSNVERQLCGS